jgi:hypothetical protein
LVLVDYWSMFSRVPISHLCETSLDVSCFENSCFRLRKDVSCLLMVVCMAKCGDALGVGLGCFLTFLDPDV